MLSLVLLSVALAQEPAPAAELAAAPALALAQGGPPPKGPPPGGKAPGPRPKGPPPKQQPHWETEPYVKPEAGAQINTGGGGTSTFVTLGASAGVRYTRVGAPPPVWTGQTRVRGLYGTGSGIESLDARLGSFIGPRYKHIGLEFGPDVFWNRMSVEGGESLDPSVGLEFPVVATAKLSKEFTIMGGISPAWLAEASREVDWSQVSVPGFGDEFSYLAGASLNLRPISLSVNYVYRIVATGAQQSLGFGINLGV